MQKSHHNLTKRFKLSRRLDRLIRAYRLKLENSLADKKNIRQLYRYTNRNLKENKTVGQIVTDKESINDDRKKCEIFAEHFRTIYKEKVDSSQHSFAQRTNEKLDFIDISPNAVQKCLSKLPLKISTSPDSIPYYFLRKTADVIYVPITRLFNSIMLQGKIPNIWKTSLVKPIFKKGSPNKVDNYRPICLTCCLKDHMQRNEVVSYS